MKSNMPCSIVKDLLPNYIEKMTSDETNGIIKQHLDTCASCKKEYDQMAAEMEKPVDLPKIELKFLKKIKRTRILAAVLCIALTVVLACLLYTSEYHYTLDKNDLSSAITDFITTSEYAFDAYALETQTVGRTLIVSFKDQTHGDNYGVAVFTKGINQKYRIISARIKPSQYSSVVQVFPLEIRNERYYAVSGYSLVGNIRFYGLDYFAYKNPGTLSADRVTQTIRFDVNNPQFLEIYPAAELDARAVNTSGDTLYDYHLVRTSLYDDNGTEITERFKIEGSDVESRSIGKAELFLLYVYIAIIIGLGFVFTRYFLTK